jgi:hypothetical protein
MNARVLAAFLIGLSGALAPGLSHASAANAAPAAPPVPGRLDPVPLAGLSVMLAPEERRAIQSVLSGEKPPADLLQPKLQGPAGQSPDGSKPALPFVYLSGIYYVGPNQWTIWLNNRRIESSAPDAEFSVVEIANRAVRINWTPKDRPDAYNFVLRPRQTFDPLAREVIEGDARRGLALKQEAAAK